MRKYLVVSLLLCMLLAALPANAWWNTGHIVVAEIAYRRLNATAKAEMERLLAIDSLPASRTFVTAAAWADDLKTLDVHAYDDWHYLDVPFSPDGTPLPPMEKTNNVEWAMRQCMTTLKSAKAPDAEKARMLRFLLHFVGDAHQPLHCTTRITKAHPMGDRGGNDYLIKAGRMRNLHMYWDSAVGLFEDVKRPMDAEAERTITGFADRATSANPPGGFPNLSESSFMKWIGEGSTLAQSVVYATPEGEEPGKEYKKKTQDTAFRQIALAGYRLADLLNGIYPAK